MSSETPQDYSVDEEILYFFRQTSATQSACDARARDLVGGSIIPVAVQGIAAILFMRAPITISWFSFDLKR